MRHAFSVGDNTFRDPGISACSKIKRVDEEPRASSLQVSFEIADIMTCDLRPNFYDVIYSRDTILHIQDKLALFRRSSPSYFLCLLCNWLSLMVEKEHIV